MVSRSGPALTFPAPPFMVLFEALNPNAIVVASDELRISFTIRLVDEHGSAAPRCKVPSSLELPPAEAAPGAGAQFGGRDREKGEGAAKNR